MLPQWTELNNFDLGTYTERVGLTVNLPIIKTFDLSTQIISGKLPTGLRLDGVQITGTPLEVKATTKSTFVIRGITQAGITDRTFTMTIDGADSPQFVTAEGQLPIGPNNQLFILDNSQVDFQLSAVDDDLSAGDELEFFIANGDGYLPPGLRLTTDGRIVGFVEPLPILEFNESTGSFDDTGYDSAYYDLAFNQDEDIKVPRKVNRNFQFTVTVKDNTSYDKRDFIIYIVSESFVRADNVLMSASTNVFTADGTYLRKPIWLTASNLGIRRANNYQTFLLETINAQGRDDLVKYILEPINPDGSISTLPPGMVLDENTGEIAGTVPYYPAITEDYKFTVNAVLAENDTDIVTVFATLIESASTGTKTLKVAKTDIEDSNRLIDNTIAIENNYYTVDTISRTNSEYDLINLREPLVQTSEHSIMTVAEETARGNTHFFIETLNTNDREFYKGQSVKFKNYTYAIDDIFDYVKIEIRSLGGEIALIDSSNQILFELTQLFTYNNRIAYVEKNDEVITIKAPSISANRNRYQIQSLFETPIDIRFTQNYDRILLENGIVEETLEVGTTGGIGIYVNKSIRKSFVDTTLEIAQTAKTFDVQIVGEVETAIDWLTDSNLGSIKANRNSDLFVKAQSNTSNSVIKYSVVEGELPTGLELRSNGDIVGKIPVYATEEELGLTFFDNGSTTFDGGATSFDREYNFTVEAGDRFGYAEISRNFNLTINDADLKNYSNVYAKPYLVKEQKDRFLSEIGDSTIIPPQYLYRSSDPEFGLQKELKTLIAGGIETTTLENFVKATTKNHKKKRFNIGSLDFAVAKVPGTDEILYEVVYLNLVDPAAATNGTTAEYIATKGNKKISADASRYELLDGGVSTNDPYMFRPNGSLITVDNSAVSVSTPETSKFYTTNIDNMKRQLLTLGDEDRDFIPLWMRTAQEGSLAELGYKLAVPLVYLKPGTGEEVKNMMLNAGFNFNYIDYEIDRYIVDNTTGNSQEQYIIFANYVYNI